MVNGGTTTAEGILVRLITLFPDFAPVWDSPGNCFRDDDGKFTRCGVFAEFSHYFRDRYEQFSEPQVAELGRFVTECVASVDAELCNAAATCFLENVGGKRFSSAFSRHLGDQALKFYEEWDYHS